MRRFLLGILGSSRSPHVRRRSPVNAFFQVTPEIVQSMRDFFAPHNAKLEELLGRPVPENWSTPAVS